MSKHYCSPYHKKNVHFPGNNFHEKIHYFTINKAKSDFTFHLQPSDSLGVTASND